VRRIEALLVGGHREVKVVGHEQIEIPVAVVVREVRRVLQRSSATPAAL
jgi:hypothetical protein